MARRSTSYKAAGVDIDAGNRLVDRLKDIVKPTLRPEVMSHVGGFGAAFSLAETPCEKPVLISSTDGVGTKLKVAFRTGVHDTVGIDLVAMCVNDVVVQGAEPLFFLDYFATGHLDVEVAEAVIRGIAAGCKDAGCSLIGGETAELPGMYAANEYDLAGFAVGIVDRDRLIDGSTITVGDKVVGLASSGIHSNGYSLVRKIIDAEISAERLDLLAEHPDLNTTLASALLAPTRIYVKDVLALCEQVPVKGLAHITGSGLPGNVPRCLPDGTRAVLSEASWKRPAIFDVLQRLGQVERAEMFSTFNMGLGMTVVVSPADAARALELLRARGLEAWDVGVIEAGRPGAEAEAVVTP